VALIGHELIGRGPTRVVVLHGWLGDHAIWAPTYPFLDRDAFTYAFVDYRGYGASRALAGAHTMQEIAADAIALADHLGWRDFAAVGHSMGGMASRRCPRAACPSRRRSRRPSSAPSATTPPRGRSSRARSAGGWRRR
jgi:pimeloyl-ACP methyl ester carboxylesterase